MTKRGKIIYCDLVIIKPQKYLKKRLNNLLSKERATGP